MNTDTLPAPKAFNTDLTRCWHALQGGRTIAVYRCLIDIADSLKAAAMLSQLLYWTRVSDEVEARDGWIYKTIAQMEDETGLTKREQGVCRKKLEALNLIVTSRKTLGGRLAFKVNLSELAKSVNQLNGIEENDSLTIPDLKGKTSSFFFRKHFSQRIAYHRDLVTLTGCIHSAVMLSCVLQDSVNICQSRPDNVRAFATLTIGAWERRTSLSHKSQLTARNRLKNLEFIFEKNFTASRRIFTLVNAKKILHGITELMKSEKRSKKEEKPSKDVFFQFGGKGEMSLAERAKWDRRKGRNGENQSLTEDILIDSTNTAINPPFSKNMTFGSNKRENSEVANTEIQKLHTGKSTSDKRENSYFRYNNYNWIYKYNYRYAV